MHFEKKSMKCIFCNFEKKITSGIPIYKTVKITTIPASKF